MLKSAKKDLERSGISVQAAEEAEMYSVPDASKICEDFKPYPALVIPYVDPWTDEFMTYERDGEVLDFQRVRYFEPERKVHGFKKEKVMRYAQPSSSGVNPYFPMVDFEFNGELLSWADVAKDPAIPIMITEGEKKSLAACLANIPTIGLGGVYNFTHDGELLPLLDNIEWSQRPVYICYDSDALANSNIQAAEGRLSTELSMKRNASTFLVRLPDLPGGAKQGVDDFLVTKGEDAMWDVIDRAPQMRRMDREVLRLNTNVAWIEREGLVLDTGTDIWMKKGDFTNGSIYSTRMIDTPNAKGDKMTRNSVAAEWLRHPHARRYDDTIFVPDTEDKAVKMPAGGIAYNRFRGLSPKQGDVEPFFELYDFLMSETDEIDHDLIWMTICYKVQNLAEKVGLGIMLLGEQGSGKSMFCEIISKMVTPYDKVMSSKELGADFNGWIETTLICVMNEAKASSLVYNLDTLKQLITDLRQPCNEKYRTNRQVDSYTFYLFNGNQRSAGAFANDDRRMVVIGCPRKHPEGEAFYDRIGVWIKAGGSAKLLDYFQNYDLEGWTPPRNAPATREKRAAYIASLEPIERVGNDIRDGETNIVMLWITSALDWAVTQEHSAFAGDVASTLPHIHIRPFYTSTELALLMPEVSSKINDRRGKRYVPGDAMMTGLMQQGVSLLKNEDNLDGFKWRGKTQQFLVIADHDRWREPITQEEFEDAMSTFPTYKEKMDAIKEREKSKRRKGRQRRR